MKNGNSAMWKSGNGLHSTHLKQCYYFETEY